MDKKLLIAGIAAFIVSLVFGFVAHGILLREDYSGLPRLFRTDAEAQGYFPFMLLSHVIKGFAFAWIYRQGIAARSPWLNQGLRFGVAAILLVVIPWYLVYYAVQPMPVMTVVKQIIYDSIGTLLMALAVAFIFRGSGETQS